MADQSVAPYEVMILHADRHQFGAGKIHVFDGERTLCGRTPEQCPGRIEPGNLDHITCLLCVRSLEAERHRVEQEREYARRNAEYEARRARDDREWREWYDLYLRSPEWAERRRLVLERASGRCEGCRKRGATQVHHLTYTHVGNELLFELVAICRSCHERIHPGADWS